MPRCVSFCLHEYRYFLSTEDGPKRRHLYRWSLLLWRFYHLVLTADILLVWIKVEVCKTLAVFFVFLAPTRLARSTAAASPAPCPTAVATLAAPSATTWAISFSTAKVANTCMSPSSLSATLCSSSRLHENKWGWSLTALCKFCFYYVTVFYVEQVLWLRWLIINILMLYFTMTFSSLHCDVSCWITEQRQIIRVYLLMKRKYNSATK